MEERHLGDSGGPGSRTRNIVSGPGNICLIWWACGNQWALKRVRHKPDPPPHRPEHKHTATIPVPLETDVHCLYLMWFRQGIFPWLALADRNCRGQVASGGTAKDILDQVNPILAPSLTRVWLLLHVSWHRGNKTLPCQRGDMFAGYEEVALCCRGWAHRACMCKGFFNKRVRVRGSACSRVCVRTCVCVHMCGEGRDVAHAQLRLSSLSSVRSTQ